MTAGESGSYGRLHLNQTDRFGRQIDPAVLKAAEQLGPRAFAYGKKLVGDPAIVANLLEESGAAVSGVFRKNREAGTTVRDLHAYLFRVFVRRINRILRRRPELVNLDFASSIEYPDPLEQKLIIDEFLTRCDPISRDMLYRRLEGFGWKQIGNSYGISAHAAESRCNQAVQRIRRKLGYRE